MWLFKCIYSLHLDLAAEGVLAHFALELIRCDLLAPRAEIKLELLVHCIVVLLSFVYTESVRGVVIVLVQE